MKLPNIKILDEKHKILHQKSSDVTFPVSKEDRRLAEDTIKYLEMSQDEKIAEKYDLRAGMGMAFVQLGKLKRIFVIANEREDHTFEEYVIINPKIISRSEELIYVGEGEGCLSVNRPVEGIVPRHARVTVEYYDYEGNKKTIRVREDLAVAFQHEIDHLDGILFTDKIDPKNPYKNKEKMREI
ncbi:MAG TPA: peptide deformylase [Candidatus Onthocola stercoravium]|nr:peptide deformylase [Candidatus Onthocola stercoravium]